MIFIRTLALSFACVCLVAIPALAQADKACPQAAPKPTQAEWSDYRRNTKDSGFLWRVVKDERVSWLYGTVHVNSVDKAIPGPQILQAIRQSNVIAPELNLLDPKILQRVAEAFQPAESKRMSALAPELIEQAMSIAKLLCIQNPAGFAKLSPEQQIVMTTHALAASLGMYADFAVDKYILAVAARMQKQIESLETPEIQIAALRKAMTFSEPDEVQLKTLLDDIKSGKAKANLMQLLETWSDSNYEKWNRYEEWCDCLHTQNEKLAYQAVNDERNGPMSQKIIALHEAGNRVFVAVGAFHFYGDKGLPKLLREAGFEVTPVLLKN